MIIINLNSYYTIYDWQFVILLIATIITGIIAIILSNKHTRATFTILTIGFITIISLALMITNNLFPNTILSGQPHKKIECYITDTAELINYIQNSEANKISINLEPHTNFYIIKEEY